MIKTIAIIGRPNVGKSALFNALIRRREALTSAHPGLTRDRSYSHFSPQDGLQYLLIDTGGLILGAQRAIDEKVNMQVDIAIDQADLLLFVVDAKDGVLPMDNGIAGKLRKTSKQIVVVVNKCDSPEHDILANEFYSMGFEQIVSVSALHRRNIFGLIDKIIGFLPKSSPQEVEKYLTLCIAGKPNVGKSTLINRIAGEERAIVDDQPGTTRNPAKFCVNIRGRTWQVADLAGMWRRKRGKETEEVISMLASRREIEDADVCILLLDLTKPLTFQDHRIAGWVIEAGTSLIIAGNKVDMVEKTLQIEESYRVQLHEQMGYVEFAPFLMISAKTGEGMEKLFDELGRVTKSAFTKIPQEELDALLPKLIRKRPPPETANQRPKVVRLYQEKVKPPVFSLVINHHRLDKIPKHWKNYIRNSIYNEYNYYGTPVVIKFRKYSKRKIKYGNV